MMIYEVEHPRFCKYLVIVFTCIQRNLNTHFPVCLINIGIPVSHYCMIFVRATVFFLYSKVAQPGSSLLLKLAYDVCLM